MNTVKLIWTIGIKHALSASYGNQHPNALAGLLCVFLDLLWRTQDRLTDMDFRGQSSKKRSLFFRNHLRCFLAVVMRRFDVLLLQPLCYKINGNTLNLDGESRTSVAKQRRFEHDGIRCAWPTEPTVHAEHHAYL